MSNLDIQTGVSSPEKKETKENLANELRMRFNKLFENVWTVGKPTEFVDSNWEKILIYKEKITDFSNRHTTYLRKIYICRAMDSSKPISIDPIKNIKSKEGILSYPDGSFDSTNFTYDESWKLIDTWIIRKNYQLNDNELSGWLGNFERTYNDYKKQIYNKIISDNEKIWERDRDKANSILSKIESGNF